MLATCAPEATGTPADGSSRISSRPHRIEPLLEAVEDAPGGTLLSTSVKCLVEFLSALSGAHRSHHTHSVCYRARATDADPVPSIARATLSLPLEKGFLFLPPTEGKQVFEDLQNIRPCREMNRFIVLKSLKN
jgi:hypothetical protein